MRARVDAKRIRTLASQLGRSSHSDVKLYLTGGATAVLEGWRDTTIDVDIRLEPELDELLRRVSELKEELDLNVELASPPDFIPELPGWRDRSPFIAREGRLDLHHFDPYSQALSKIERGFAEDLQDVAAMIERGLVEPRRAHELFDAIAPELYRYPAIDPAAFRAQVDAVLG
jgi:hypothetical protein